MKKRIIALSIMFFFILLPFVYINVVSHKSLYNPTKLDQSNTISEFIDQLDLKWDKLLKTYSVPGAAISIIANGSTTTLVGGKANYWKNDPLQQEDYFQIASISKTQCAFAIMKLLQDGLIDLDVPVSTYLTRWSLPENGFDNNNVTIRRILSHTAGLSVSSVPYQLKLDTLPSIEEALTEADVKVIVEPGSFFIYSGGGYGILQLIIEEVSGLPYQDYMRNEIFQPLDLNNTFAGWDTEIGDNLVKGHGNLLFHTIQNFSPFKAAAGHYSTIDDLTDWCELFLDGQTVLNETIFNLMLTPQFGSDWGYALGLNWKKLENGLVTIGHSGANWGYHSTFRFLNETGDGIAILTNGDRGAKLISLLLYEWERILGGTDYNDFYIEEQNRSLTIDIVLAIVSLILIVLLILGNRFSIISFAFQDKPSSYVSKNPKIVKSLRWIFSILFSLLSIFLLFIFGLFYNSMSFKPTNFIWTILLILEWSFWIIPASHLLSFNFKRTKMEST
ncbi:MAG: serine hydrolase [Asgard group archaeon]|nr:serine hydrolase [Asgard group archaeon]